MSGDELLGQPRHDGYADPITGLMISGPEPAGAQVLVAELQREYGVDQENRTIASLSAYFGLRRGNSSMDSYISMSEITYDEARTEAGLQMHDVGRTFFLLQGSGLDARTIQDYKLRID